MCVLNTFTLSNTPTNFQTYLALSQYSASVAPVAEYKGALYFEHELFAEECFSDEELVPLWVGPLEPDVQGPHLPPVQGPRDPNYGNWKYFKRKDDLKWSLRANYGAHAQEVFESFQLPL